MANFRLGDSNNLVNVTTNGAGDVVKANTERLCMLLKRIRLILFGGIVVAARQVAAIGRRSAERTVLARFAGRRWSDLTERMLNDELTGQNHRSFLP